MAFTERYITADAAGGNDGSQFAEGGGGVGPWTLAEALTSAAAGDRGNVEGGSYSLGADAFTNAGTVSAPIVLRGCNTSIGDLDDQGRNADGTLDTTNMPDITLTGLLTMNTFCVLQNLDFTGALSSQLIGDSTVDHWEMVSCRVVNTQNNASARCVVGDNANKWVNCDFECSGASHTALLLADSDTTIIGCRFKVAAAAICASVAHVTCIGCSFMGNASGDGLFVDAAFALTRISVVDHCTFYGIGRALVFQTGAHAATPVVTNCHVTDCSEYCDNTSATTIYMIEGNNRLRDNTTPRTGLEPITFNEVTTDTGGAETDYNDAGSDDFRLIAAAPGYETGMTPFTSIGAAHIADPAGGGGNPVTPPSLHAIESGIATG